MKSLHHNKTKHRASKGINKAVGILDCENSLDKIAEELTNLAQKFLPDNALQGAYAGQEEDMRQEGILMALGWYLRQKVDSSAVQQYPWHAPKAMAAALQIQRREHAKARKREAAALQALPPDWQRTPYHPSLDRVCDWSVSTLVAVLREAIRRALLEHRISPANAAIALGVLIDGVEAKEMAKRLGIHRSAIYQHLGRVRRELPDIIDGIEVPLHDFF